MSSFFKSQNSFRVSSRHSISFGSPLVLETGSPPPEQIIRDSNLHPRTISTSNTTKILNFAPKSKTVDSNKIKTSNENESFFNNPLCGRLLTAIPPLRIQLNDTPDYEVTNPVIENGILSSSLQLNKTNERAPKFENFNMEKHDDDNDFFTDYCFYNSPHALSTFDNITEIYKTNRVIIYRCKSRIDQQWYCIKTGINFNEPDRICKLSPPNHRIHKEFNILSNLNHKNIVRYHKCWLEQQCFFLQMEYLVGESLYYFMYSTNYKNENMGNLFSIKEKFPLTNKVSEAAAKQIVKQIGNALHYLHIDQQIIHNDIQPANVLINFNQNSILNDKLNVNSIRSFIYQGLLGESCVEVTFKLIDFGQSFYLDKCAIDYSSPYWLRSSGQETKEHLINRDIQGLGMTTIHALFGPDNFFPEEIHRDGLVNKDGGLLCEDQELTGILKKMIDLESLMSSRTLMKEISEW